VNTGCFGFRPDTAELLVVTLDEVSLEMFFDHSVLAGGFLRDPIAKASATASQAPYARQKLWIE
jgi:hypothetical protein